MIKGQMSIFDFISNEPEPIPEPLPCDNCIFDVAGSCAYNTRECHCVNGNKQITKESGWVLINGGKNLPPCTGKWKDLEVLIYYEDTDSYGYEVWEYKDWTFKGKDKHNRKQRDIVAWKQIDIPYDYSWDNDINEIHYKLIALAAKYRLSIDNDSWTIWEHVPKLGYRMSITLSGDSELFTELLFEELQEIVEFSKSKNIELSPMQPVSIHDGSNMWMSIFSMFLDKARQQYKEV